MYLHYIVVWWEGEKITGDLSLYKIGQAPLVFGFNNVLFLFLFLFLFYCDKNIELI